MHGILIGCHAAFIKERKFSQVIPPSLKRGFFRKK